MMRWEIFQNLPIGDENMGGKSRKSGGVSKKLIQRLVKEKERSKGRSKKPKSKNRGFGLAKDES